MPQHKRKKSTKRHPGKMPAKGMSPMPGGKMVKDSAMEDMEKEHKGKK